MEAFETAVEKGADAVYVGMPGLNARNLAREFSLPEIAAMTNYGHDRGKKVFAAMNSLVKEEEISLAMESLDFLANIKIDAVIIQDLGLYYLARKYFPELRLHASTLMLAHNSLAVKQFAEMGFKRVVLARELSLEEITLLRKETTVELEVFVHGAMCFSYSGLCLFSSFLGGKGGLRGRCVQPCRRKYTWAGRGKGGKSGYFFSMNDQAAIDHVSELKRLGIDSIKIEGRMRSASYVGAVVEAYRMVLDAPEEDPKALTSAKEILRTSMGRRLSAGYFLGREADQLLSPHHSGNIGQFLGRIEGYKGNRISLLLNHELKQGDRLRVHQERDGERISFTAKRIWRGGVPVECAGPRARVSIECPNILAAGDSVYKVDEGEMAKRSGKTSTIPVRRLRSREMIDPIRVSRVQKAILAPLPPRRQGGRRFARWVKVDDMVMLKDAEALRPEEVIILLTRNTFLDAQRRHRLLLRKKVIWSLPPIIFEQEVNFFREAVGYLVRAGFSRWQIAHLGQIQLMKGLSVTVLGDYQLNILNSLGLLALRELSVDSAQLAIEADRDNYQAICRQSDFLKLGLTIYGRPPLFTARLTPSWFQYGVPFMSPKGESFVLGKEQGLTLAFAEKEFSLLAMIEDLSKMGFDYGVVDLSHLKGRKKIFAGHGRGRGQQDRERGVSTFNYSGRLW